MSLTAVGWIVVLLAGVIFTDDVRAKCTADGISVGYGGKGDESISIRYGGQLLTSGWGTMVSGTRKVHDRKGNSFLFVALTEGGSCGDSGLLVAVSDGRLISFNFEGAPCGGWRVIEPDKIVFHTVWMDICGLGWCRGCGPSYPIMWTIDGCQDGKIVARRSKSLRDLYSDRDGKVEVDNMLKDLHQMITRSSYRTPPATTRGPLEKEFCSRVRENQRNKRLLELLFSLDSSLGDRFYFFDKPKEDITK